MSLPCKSGDSSAREERNHLWKVVFSHVRLIQARLSNKYILWRLLDQKFNKMKRTPQQEITPFTFLKINLFIDFFITHHHIWKRVIIKPELAWRTKLINTYSGLQNYLYLPSPSLPIKTNSEIWMFIGIFHLDCPAVWMLPFIPYLKLFISKNK